MYINDLDNKIVSLIPLQILLYSWNERMAISLVYKNINSFYSKHCESCVFGRERQRTAMIDTIWRQTNSEPCFFDWRFDTALVLSLGAIRPPIPVMCLLADSYLINILSDSLRSKNFCIIYFLDAHTYFFSLNSCDSFPLSLVYTGSYPVLKS